MRPGAAVRRPKPGAFRFAVLGSGSRGNAAVIAHGRTCVLLDCGFSARETGARLQRLGLSAESLTAILVTHEHDDHVGGVAAVARRFDLPVWMTAGTWSAVAAVAGALPQLRLFSPHECFAIDDVEVRPFPVPHDAREPSQFVFGDGDARLGFLTDTGSTTPHIETMLSGCEALVLECNHDREMLRTGSYPASLKERIAGTHGHLDNDAAGRIAASLDTSRLRCLVAAHLSQKNNTPELARRGLSAALDCDPEWIEVADQDRGLGWRAVSARTI